MRPDETLGYWLMQTMRSVANAFADVLQTSCATLSKPYVITPQQWFALSLLAREQDLPIGILAQRLVLDAKAIITTPKPRSAPLKEAGFIRATRRSSTLTAMSKSAIV